MTATATTAKAPEAKDGQVDVSHASMTSEVNSRGPLREPGPLFRRAFKLLTDPHSRDMVDRQTNMLKKICADNGEGFFFNDLSVLAESLNVISELFNENDSYRALEEAVCEILAICRLPFRKDFSNDQFRNIDSLCELLRACGKMLLVPIVNIQISAAEVVTAFVSRGRTRFTLEMKAVHDIKQLQNSFNQRIVESTGVIENLVEALRLSGEDDFDLRYSVVHCLKELSYHDENSSQIARAGALELMINYIDPTSTTEEMVFDVVEVIWNIIEYEPSADELLGTRHAVNILKELFTHFVVVGYREKDKEIRNEVLIISHYIAYKEENRHFFYETGFLDVLLTFATCVELQLENEMIKAHVLTTAKEDFEMKMTLLNIISTLSWHQECLESIVQSKFVPAMLMYLDTEHVYPCIEFWHNAQLYEIQCSVLNILFSLVPLCPVEYQLSGGNMIMLSFLIANRGDEKLRHGALQVLYQTAALPDFRRELGENGAISALLSVFNDTTYPSYSVQCAALALGQLCADNYEPNQLQFGDQGGIESLLSWIKRKERKHKKFDSSINKDHFMTCIIDAVWDTVCRSSKNEARFMFNDGVGALLSFLEEASPILKNQILSCLVDLLENPNAVPLAREWRSETTARGVAQVLVNLWDKFNDLGSAQSIDDQNGILTNLENPLSKMKDSSADRCRKVMSTLKFNSGPDSLITFDTCSRKRRAKVFATFAKIGFSGYDYLSTAQESTLRCIGRYIDFKEGQVWIKIKEGLEEEGLRPISDDIRRIDDEIEACYQKAKQCQDEQKELWNLREGEDNVKEMTFYQGINDTFQSEVQAKLRYKNRHKPAISYEDRVALKAKRNEMLKHSVKSSQDDENDEVLKPEAEVSPAVDELPVVEEVATADGEAEGGKPEDLHAEEMAREEAAQARNQELQERDAATTVQAAYRGHITRKMMNSALDESSSLQAYKESRDHDKKVKAESDYLESYLTKGGQA